MFYTEKLKKQTNKNQYDPNPKEGQWHKQAKYTSNITHREKNQTTSYQSKILDLLS